MDRSVNSVGPNQTAPERAMKCRLGSERCKVGTLIARGMVTLPSHKGALCRRQEICAKGRSSVPMAGGGERTRGISPLSKRDSGDLPREHFMIQNIFICGFIISGVCVLVKNLCKVS